MKKQNKYLISSILIIGFFCFMNESIGQVKVLNIPEKFMVPLENVKLEKSSKTYKKAWLVFSDRDDNPAYATPELGSVKNTARFMESFYVIDESGSYLQLARGGTLDPATGTIKNHEEFGWMPKDNLLLWAHCMVTEKSEIPKKVMILNTVEYTKENPSESEMNVLRFHKKPNLTVPSGIESRLFEVFFIYKKSTDGRSYLLGRSSKIGGLTNPENYIVGWAPRTRLNFWDHRIAIEPNWMPDAAQERRNNNVKASIFRDQSEALYYKNGRSYNQDNIAWDSDPYERRKPGEYRRFPFIELKDGIIKAGVMGQIFSEAGSTLSLDQQAKIEKGVNSMIKRKRTINIVFVVDGSASMLPYFRPIANAINISINKLTGSINNLKFGAVVYRDFAEGQYLTEKQNITSKYQDVINFLNNVYSGSKNLNDRDNPEALNYGLREALRNINMPDDETNFVVLVGDAGNHNRNDISQVDQKTIIDLMVAKNVNFMAFQVNHPANKDYDSFITQSQELLISTARNLYSINAEINSIMKYNKTPQLNSNGQGVSELVNASIQGKVIYAASGQQIKPYYLQEHIVSLIDKTEKDVNMTIELLNRILRGEEFSDLGKDAKSDGTNQNIDTFKPIVLNILRQAGISESQLNVLKYARYQFYITGYTTDKVAGCNSPVFQSVLFLTREEFATMVADLNKLSNSRSMNESRRAMYNAWLGILKDHIGGGISEEELTSWSLEKITETVFGLPSQSEFIKNVRLQDITDPSRMQDRDFIAWQSKIERQAETLKKILNDDYTYSFRSNDEVYYWIAQSQLP